MKKLIIIFLLLISGYSFAQDRTMNKAKVKDTLFVYKGIWFGVDSSYMDVAGGTASDTTYWNYPTYDGHKMINARQSKQVNADSGFASSGYIWLKAPLTKTKGSYYIGSGTPGIGATSSGNNIFGYNAGALTYSGGYNNIIGYQAGAMLYDGYQNTFIGANSGYTSSSAYKNVFIGHSSGYFNTKGAFNTFLGWQSGYSTTSGLRNLYLGYMAGNYMTTESNRIILNTIDRTTKAKDTVFSPIYIYETSDTATSKIWLNGNVNVRGNFTVHGSALSGVAGDTTLIYATKPWSDGRFFTLAGANLKLNISDTSWVLSKFRANQLYPTYSYFHDYLESDYIPDVASHYFWQIGDTAINLLGKNRAAQIYSTIADRIAGDKWGLVAPGSGYINVLNSKKIIATTFYTADSLDVLSVSTSNLFIGQGGKRTLTGTNNIVIGNSAAGDALGSGSYNIVIGSEAGSALLNGSYSACLGQFSGNTSTGSFNLFLGYAAGRYLTTENNRIVIDNRNRASKANDTTTAPIYVYTAAATANQIIYLNGNVRITDNLRVNGQFNFGVDAQAADDYVVSIPGITSYTTGQVIIFSANTLNTGACTINVNGLGAKSLKSLHDQDPEDSYIEAGSIITAIYDGTNFQIQTPDANP